jgi:hypothetical protein
LTLQGKQDVPFITWDIEEFQFRVTVRGVKFEKAEDNQESIITSKSDCAYRARIRKVDDDVWTPGFVSPLPVFGVSLLEEGTDHILEMCRVDREGMPLSDDPPKLFKLHDGQIEEIT